MKKFIAPEMEVSKFNLSDILTTSGGTGSDPVITQLFNAGEYDGTISSDNGVTYVD